MSHRYGGDRQLLYSLYLSQSLYLLVGLGLIRFAQGLPAASWGQLFLPLSPDVITLPLLFVALAGAYDWMMNRRFPKAFRDESGVTQQLFTDRPIWHILLMSAVIGLCEEVLFRLAIQPLLGLFWTSLLFALMHVNYLRKWALTLSVFLLGLGLGALYEVTGSGVAPIAAHALNNALSAFFLQAGVYNRTENE